MALRKRQREPEELDDTKNCPVCFSAFDVSDHLPRIFPCFHTACEPCVKNLIRGKSLTCPQCRKRYKSPSGSRSFQENKYIMRQLQENLEDRSSFSSILSTLFVEESERISSSEIDLFEKCQLHYREKSIFCRSPGCRKDICQVCLLGPHRFHEAVDYMEENTRFEKLDAYLQHCRHTIFIAKNEMEKACIENIKEIHYAQAAYVKILDNFAEDINKKMQEENEALSGKLKLVEEQIFTLQEVKSGSSMKERVDTMAEVEEKLQDTMTDKIAYTVLSYENFDFTLRDECRISTEKTFSLIPTSAVAEFTIPRMFNF